MTIPTDEEIDDVLSSLDCISAAYIHGADVEAEKAARLIRSLRQQLAAKDSIGDGPAALPVGPPLFDDVEALEKALNETFPGTVPPFDCGVAQIILDALEDAGYRLAPIVDHGGRRQRRRRVSSKQAQP